MFPQIKEFFASSLYILATIILLIGGVVFLLVWLNKRKSKRRN